MLNRRIPLLVANWKLNGTKSMVHNLLNPIIGLTRNTNQAKVVILPPAIFMPLVASYLQETNIAWGGQDIAPYTNGAYTGGISAEMLAEFNCQYVLVGHSEQKQYYGETAQQRKNKVIRASNAGLTPILCLGETIEAYEAQQTQDMLLAQLSDYFSLGFSIFKKAVLAYEPVWAIGTGSSLCPNATQRLHQWLRTQIADHFGSDLAHQIRILYGGSVQPSNASALFNMPDIDGGLVGSASLSAESFLQIYGAF